MCGIAGLAFADEISGQDMQLVVRKMTSYMNLRGPDAEGLWSSHGVVLGHRRLAILDLDLRSNQPMVLNNDRYIIVFNGEIYNFRELRCNLEVDGIIFHTTSDTEVLLALFARDRELMLPLLRGMFAFAIWDKDLRELFVARDPYGIKPLYYTSTKYGLIFASQVKALIASGLVPSEQEPAGLAGFYLWGSVPEPWTLYRDVFALPAGHWMRVRNGVPELPVSWHDIRHHWRDEMCKLPSSEGELQELVRQTVADSVKAHLVADVPVSIFLSGGIDSAVVAGLASEGGGQVEGITIGFDEFSGRHEDEVPVAAAIANHYGLKHSVHQVSHAEFEQDVPRIIAAMDQPSIDGVNTWFASKAAAERGFKVVLSGVGGDELFCGYPSFKQLPRLANVGKVIASIPGARALMDVPCKSLARCLNKPKLAALPLFMDSLEGCYFLKRSLFLPEELPALMGRELAQEGLKRLGGLPPGMTFADARGGTEAIGLLESTHYLRQQLIRDSDWASMGHSLELRTPLVDAVVLKALGPYVSGFAGGMGKAMLARAPLKPLPESIINRPKTGFGLPMAQWLSEMTDKSDWSDLPMLATSGTPWARRWARIVVQRMTE